MSENPQVCVIDTVLGGEDGYFARKGSPERSPSASIIMLASRYAPYDQATRSRCRRRRLGRQALRHAAADRQSSKR